ncbi:MAG TPA: AI-2E family transporter, partial [Cryptosporangiaceae bacterium]|nr:AI-2E family transporter [Cryptosporangiaceae bacterium]
VWILVAGFLAVALHPAVSWPERRVTRGRRWLGTLLVFLLGAVVIGGLLTAFIAPLVSEGQQFAKQVPGLVEEIRAGKGPLGELVQRFNLQDSIPKDGAKAQELLGKLGTPALQIAQSALSGVIALITIVVLSYLMVQNGPRLVDAALALLPDGRRERVRRVGGECARSVTGYVNGNLLISVILGTGTYVLLLILGVPYAGLLALFVAVADLIPMFGGLIGAVGVVFFGFVHSVPTGIVLVVFFLIYQQVENYLLSPYIMSRTVSLDALTVLIAILVGGSLGGLVGALFAIPVASIIRVIARDLWRSREGRASSDSDPDVGDTAPATAGP